MMAWEAAVAFVVKFGHATSTSHGTEWPLVCSFCNELRVNSKQDCLHLGTNEAMMVAKIFPAETQERQQTMVRQRRQKAPIAQVGEAAAGGWRSQTFCITQLAQVVFKPECEVLLIQRGAPPPQRLFAGLRAKLQHFMPDVEAVIAPC